MVSKTADQEMFVAKTLIFLGVLVLLGRDSILDSPLLVFHRRANTGPLKSLKKQEM
jgi:hypothetical protein